jgi:UDP-N-acetylglucosamine--N-acetylmuramyl-(pentapeptide) pyrophosphoryl-undecaprenol N-acetylglucosamine transferase
MKKRVLMMAGGTGGHIFPALAVARALRSRGYDLLWLGSQVGMERELVGDEFPMAMMSVRAIRGKGMIKKLLSPFRLCLAIWQAWRVVRRFNPDLVIGMGGFVSGPGGVAARLSRKPLMIHEQNAVAGMTNRILAKYAAVVLQAFPNAFPSVVAAKTIGNPLRLTITAVDSPADRFKTRSAPLRLLIVGGSRGAQAINQAMLRVLANDSLAPALEVWHQTGKSHFEQIQQAYQQMKIPAKVSAFIDDIAQAYAWADLLICRAGALTVSEISAVGVPSILIPFPYAVDDHQYHNAAYLAKAGAAEIIRQNDDLDARLVQALQKFIHQPAALLVMAGQARTLAKPQALSAIVTLCDELTGDMTS